MPAKKAAKKTTSPEAEQKKLWKRDLQQYTRERAQITRECTTEFRRSLKASDAASRAARAIHAKHLKLAERLTKTETRELARIDRRLAILRGRLGI